jgi:hypothetical protein
VRGARSAACGRAPRAAVNVQSRASPCPIVLTLRKPAPEHRYGRGTIYTPGRGQNQVFPPIGMRIPPIALSASARYAFQAAVSIVEVFPVCPDQTRLYRRALLRKGAALVASSFAIIPVVVSSKPAAAGKADKAVVRYQDQPKDGKICVNCWAYVAGPRAAEGACKVIEGPINANGWCMAYSPKHRGQQSKS